MKQETKESWNLFSGMLFFVAFMPYVYAIFRGETVPSPVSWAIWASVDTLAWFAMRKKNAATGQLAGAVIGAWSVTALAIIYGKPMIGFIEWVSLVGAVVGVVLWQMTGNAVLAIICSQVAVFAGAIPTFVNGYNNPAQENPVAWSIWLASCVCALFAVKKWDLANALQPLTFTAIETTMVILVVIRPHWL